MPSVQLMITLAWWEQSTLVQILDLLARFQRASVQRVAVTPGIASLNPGLMSSQPFRAAGLHAGGVKEISPR